MKQVKMISHMTQHVRMYACHFLPLWCLALTVKCYFVFKTVCSFVSSSTAIINPRLTSKCSNAGSRNTALLELSICNIK